MTSARVLGLFGLIAAFFTVMGGAVHQPEAGMFVAGIFMFLANLYALFRG